MDIETKRYRTTVERARVIVASLVRKKEIPTAESLTQLYESEGIAPEIVKEQFAKEKIAINIPSDFYVKLTEKHMSSKEIEEKVVDVSNLLQRNFSFTKMSGKRSLKPAF